MKSSSKFLHESLEYVLGVLYKIAVGILYVDVGVGMGVRRMYVGTNMRMSMRMKVKMRMWMRRWMGMRKKMKMGMRTRMIFGEEHDHCLPPIFSHVKHCQTTPSYKVVSPH